MNEEMSGEVVLRFRNYIPKDPTLRAFHDGENGHLHDGNGGDEDDQQQAKAKPIDALVQKQKGTGLLLESSEALVKELEAKVMAVVDQVDQVKVAPRKVDWDLKRDVARRLKKLARQTQRAIVELAEEERKRRAEEEGESSGSDGESSSSSGSEDED